MNEEQEKEIIRQLWHEAMRLPGVSDEPLPKAVSIYDAVAELRLRIGATMLIVEAQERELQQLREKLRNGGEYA